jgi:hypothetical protein
MKKKETHTFQVEAKVPAIYYAGRNGYAIEHKGGFIPLTSESQVKQHLVASKVPDGEFNDLLCKIRLENFVSYIGPVAGHQPGIHIAPESGQPFLVTTGPKIISGVEGDWNFIGDFLRDLLGDEIQLQAALAWLRQARRNVLAGKRRPLPAAVFVGPRKCGKTLFIELARLCLGGRVASALAALSGSTQFNGHTLGSELLVIDDEIASKQHSTRTALAQGIKKQLFAGSVSIEAKHRDPIAMRPVQGIIIAVNDEPEHLQVLPAMDDSVADKISLFSCERARLGDLTEPDEITAAIKAELPAFCFFLDTTDHPEELKDSRTGAAAWQNPAVQESLQSIAPEERFRELLAQCTPITEGISSSGFWRGTSAEIERLLSDNDVTRNSARSLLSWPSACGVFLGRLETGRRAALSKSCIHGINQWRITGLEPLGAEQAQLRW